MNNILPPILPEDLIVEILLRLPVRSLLRLKCVCKSWLYLISDPKFSKSHFDLAAIPTHRVLMRSTDDSKVKSIDVDASLLEFSTEVEFTIPPPRICRCPIGIIGSCRGFLLLPNYVCFNQVFEFIIWNPSTGLRKQIINVLRLMRHTYLYGFGYDSSTDDYAIVLVKLPLIQSSAQLVTEVHYFSLRTNSWYCTKDTVSHYRLGSRFIKGLFLNGVLHWLVKSYASLRIIIAFDVMEKRLSEIQLPYDVAVGLESKTYHLREMGGYLALYFMGETSEIWLMKEYKLKSSWTKSYVFSTNFFYCPHLFFRKRFTKNDQGELLELHKLRTLGNKIGKFDVVDFFIYRESLLSLPEPKKSTKSRSKRAIKRRVGWDDFIHNSEIFH